MMPKSSDEGVWTCGHCGRSSEAHGMSDHPSNDCVYAPVWKPFSAASSAADLSQEARTATADTIESWLAEWDFQMREHGPNPAPLADFIAERLATTVPAVSVEARTALIAEATERIRGNNPDPEFDPVTWQIENRPHTGDGVIARLIAALAGAAPVGRTEHEAAVLRDQQDAISRDPLSFWPTGPEPAAPVADGDLREQVARTLFGRQFDGYDFDKCVEFGDWRARESYLSADAVLAVVDGRVQAAEAALEERTEQRDRLFDAAWTHLDDKDALREQLAAREAVIAELGKITGDSSLTPAQKSAQCRALALRQSPLHALHEYGAKVLEDAADAMSEPIPEDEFENWDDWLRARSATLRTPTPTDLGSTGRES